MDRYKHLIYEDLSIVIIGPAFSGKSNLARALLNKELYKEYNYTIGVEFLSSISPKHQTWINIWDLAGSDKFSTLVIPYIQKNIVLVFCYIAGDYNSFVKMVKKYNFYNDINILKNKPIIIVATKIDEFEVHPPYEFFGEQFAKKVNSTFILTSSFTKQGIKELLKTCIKLNRGFQINPETDTVIYPNSNSVCPCCRIF